MFIDIFFPYSYLQITGLILVSYMIAQIIRLLIVINTCRIKKSTYGRKSCLKKDSVVLLRNDEGRIYIICRLIPFSWEIAQTSDSEVITFLDNNSSIHEFSREITIGPNADLPWDATFSLNIFLLILGSPHHSIDVCHGCSYYIIFAIILA